MNALCDAHPNAFIGHSTTVNQRLDLAFDMLMRTVGLLPFSTRSCVRRYVKSTQPNMTFDYFRSCCNPIQVCCIYTIFSAPLPSSLILFHPPSHPHRSHCANTTGLMALCLFRISPLYVFVSPNLFSFPTDFHSFYSLSPSLSISPLLPCTVTVINLLQHVACQG